MNIDGANKMIAGLSRQPMRFAWRVGALAMLVALATCDGIFHRGDSTTARAAWAARWLRRCLRACEIRITVSGARPNGRVLVANHTSYLDIAVIAAVQPTVFVARHDLQTLPVFGRLVRHAGTIFINRQRKRDLLAVIAALPRAVEAGAVPTFFPEGANTNGHALLPFRSSLFAPAVAHQWRVIPVHIRYRLEPGDGLVERDVCWWGGMKFLPHFVALLTKRRIHVHVTIGQSVRPGHDRKALARELQRRIETLGRVGLLGGMPSLREMARAPSQSRATRTPRLHASVHDQPSP